MREGKIEIHALSKGHYPGRRMNSNDLPGMVNLGFWDCRKSQDWGLQSHRNEGLEIVFLETGAMGFEVDGKSYDLHAGSLTITRPWQLHRLGNPNIGLGRLHWIILDVGVRRPNQEWNWPSWLLLSPNDLAELTRKLRRGENSVWMANARVREVFRELADCVMRWQEPRMTSRLAIAVNRLLMEVLEVVVEQQSDESADLETRSRTVDLFLKDLALNPASSAEAWSLASMAEHCGLGITSMAKYCRKLVNNGPMAYLNLCRLEHSAQILKHDRTVSVTEVAMMTGFNSSQYFATLFQRQYHTTPTQYRTQF